jgi:large subunit GTPase 1
LVGYPNVGKSSTINALIGAKKVSVSSTPGKTKHFQTIHLSDRVVLCDCPGLVFPNFASTKADLVCNGVLPIDQLREYTGPAALVARRIPKPFLEAVYGIQIRTRPIEEGGTGIPTAEELLSAYARHRGFMTQGLGQPDQSRAARYILKDYVNGKLLYCDPPPGTEDPIEFNRELYDMSHLPVKRRIALAAAMEAMSVEGDDEVSLSSNLITLPAGPKSERLDKSFFKSGRGNAGHLTMPFNHKYTEQGQMASGKHLSGRKMRAMIALETGMDPKEVQSMTGKKHFKGGQRGKGKRAAAAGQDDDE